MEAVMDGVKVRRYDAYVDSGIEWLGEVPKEWKIKTIGSITELRSDKNHPNEQVLSVYREYGVITKDSRDDNHNVTSENTSTYKLVKPGYLVINKMKAWQGSMGISFDRGIVSPAYITCKIIVSDIYNRFLHYLLRSNLYIGEYNRLSYGVRIGQWDMHYEDFKRIPIAIPSFDEQIVIANFLDEKIGKIENAISIKQKQIELLKEHRQILIHKAVTLGLDADVKLIDSGVEWIGQIPAHWEIQANRVLFEERNEAGNESLPMLTVSIHHAVSSEELSDEDNLRGKVRIEDKSSYKRVKPNDIVYNMMRAWQGAIGSVRVEGMVSPAYVVAKPKKEINADYFEYLFRTEDFISQMNQHSKGITDFRKRLYWNEFKQMKIIVPPIEEQVLIAEHIGAVSDKVNTAILLKEREIEKLKEYKNSLINEAVTGKIRIHTT